MESGVKFTDVICRGFRRHNLMEFKSPGDELGADALHKLLAYSSLYKASAARGNALGRIEGHFETLFRLVGKGLLSLADASAEAGLSISKFEEKMAEHQKAAAATTASLRSGL